MKQTILGFALGMIALASSAFAGEPARYADQGYARHTDTRDALYADRDGREETRIVTGSHIKQRVKKHNIILTGTSAPVLVIDQREVQRNGYGTVADVLRHYPGIQISGH